MRRTDTPVVPVRAVGRSEALVAWRFWGLDESEGTTRLASPFRATPWPVAAPFQAECLATRLGGDARRAAHAAPGPRCRCGVYGESYRRLRTYLGANVVRPSASPVLGRVLLWGSIVAEGDAWRATYAYPERLLVPTLVHDAYRVAADLEAYGVPVSIMDVATTFTALHPATRVRAAR
jgi:hypothetical protein